MTDIVSCLAGLKPRHFEILTREEANLIAPALIEMDNTFLSHSLAQGEGHTATIRGAICTSSPLELLINHDSERPLASITSCTPRKLLAVPSSSVKNIE